MQATRGQMKHNEFVLKFWPDPYEMTLLPDGRAIIKGTTDTAIARSLYAGMWDRRALRDRDVQ
jgi:molybdopterin-synthase adenylyltransferase